MRILIFSPVGVFLIPGVKELSTVFLGAAAAVFVKIFRKLFIVAVTDQLCNFVMPQAGILQQFLGFFNADPVQRFLKCGAGFFF